MFSKIIFVCKISDKSPNSSDKSKALSSIKVIVSGIFFIFFKTYSKTAFGFCLCSATTKASLSMPLYSSFHL